MIFILVEKWRSSTYNSGCVHWVSIMFVKLGGLNLRRLVNGLNIRRKCVKEPSKASSPGEDSLCGMGESENESEYVSLLLNVAKKKV